MIANGIEPEVATKICDDLVSFANYGFPESHAWSFALIAYATAWLKANHPAEFYLGLLNSQPMGFYPVSTLIHDARRMGVEVRPPCLVHGDWECTVEETANADKPALRVGWRFVRGIATKAIDALRAARERAPFTGVEDVVRRAALGRADALALARAGTFGVWAPDRRQAAWEALRATGDLLPLAPALHSTHEPPPMDRDRLVLLDYYATGMSLAGHPVERVREQLRRWGAVDSRDLEAIDSGRDVIVGGLVTVRQRPATAGGTIFLLLEDEHGFLNVIVPKQLVEANAEVVKLERGARAGSPGEERRGDQRGGPAVQGARHARRDAPGAFLSLTHTNCTGRDAPLVTSSHWRPTSRCAFAREAPASEAPVPRTGQCACSAPPMSYRPNLTDTPYTGTAFGTSTH
jgi:error-prone DNA polymerase